MKASELVKTLQGTIEHAGDIDVSIEAAVPGGGRTEQRVYEVLGNKNKILILSKEAWDADPLMSLPIMDSDGASSEPH